MNSQSYCLPLCKSQDQRQMIGCDKCDNWFHLECIGLTEKQVSLFPEEWFCKGCQESILKEEILSVIKKECAKVFSSEESKAFIKHVIACEASKFNKPSKEVMGKENDSQEQYEQNISRMQGECEQKMQEEKEMYEEKLKQMQEDNEHRILEERKQELLRIEEIKELYEQKLKQLQEDNLHKLLEEREQELFRLKGEYECKIQALESLCARKDEEVKTLKTRLSNKRKLSLSQQSCHQENK